MHAPAQSAGADIRRWLWVSPGMSLPERRRLARSLLRAGFTQVDVASALGTQAVS